jgi:Gram-negative bacterial TonB protein C-terminal
MTTCFLFAQRQSPAQSVNFEGIVDYQVEIKSMIKGISDESMARILGYGPTERVYIKNGTYYRTTSLHDEYFLPAKQRAFNKFRKTDTLYYVEYNSDTSALLNISKGTRTQEIAGYPCKSLTITSTTGAQTYFYNSDLRMDPAFDKENSLSHFNDYIKEARAIYLKLVDQNVLAITTFTATRVTPKTLDDKIFELPSLPVTKFDVQTYIQSPEYKSGQGWDEYLKKNLKANLGARYIKIPKGESTASQKAEVRFIVKATGEVDNVEVTNHKEIHPALANEAIRVVRESSGWRPATVHGQKIDYWLIQYITFEVSK